VFLLLGFIIVIVEVAVCSAGSMGSIPNKNTLRELQEAWLEFHKTGLCQEIDAGFVFHGDGVEVWSRIESDRQYQKFQALFEPLKAANSVTLYITRGKRTKEGCRRSSPSRETSNCDATLVSLLLQSRGFQWRRAFNSQVQPRDPASDPS
jgi:hypothetical protein